MNNQEQFKSDEIDLTALIKEVLDKKFKIAIVTTFFAIFSIIYSLTLPNIFSSSAVLESASQPSGSQMASSVSGLASLAGLSLGVQSNDTVYLIEVLKSFDLFKENLIRNPSHIQNLVAIEYYDKSQKKIIYNDEVFDSKRNQWMKDQPSFQEIYRSAIVPNLEIRQKLRNASLIEVRFSHQSPIFAKEYVTSLVETLNETSKSKDLEETERSLKYLQEAFQNTSQLEVRNSIGDLLTNQLKKRMYANSRQDYLVEIIENPLVPELKSSPRRSVMVINSTLAGFIISLLYFLIQFFRKTYLR